MELLINSICTQAELPQPPPPEKEPPLPPATQPAPPQQSPLQQPNAGETDVILRRTQSFENDEKWVICLQPQRSAA